MGATYKLQGIQEGVLESEMTSFRSMNGHTRLRGPMDESVVGSTSVPNDIVLFTYPGSPFGLRVQLYLQLREQPFIMPRPDREKLGVKYRRIPILAIRRDIYLDTRLILRTLERRFPDGKLGSDKPEHKFAEKLLEKYMVEGPVVQEAAGLVPTAILQNPKFAEDRKGFLGRKWTQEELDQGRPECLLFVRNLFDLLESTVLADRRKWVLETEKPSLADVQAIWPLDWGTKLGLPSHVVSEEKFPKVYAWMSRLRAAAASSARERISMTGDVVVRYLRETTMETAQDEVDENDPQDLEKGTQVEISPADWGSDHRDSGRLVGLAPDEVTIMVEDAVTLRLHAPRTGFKVTAIGTDASGGSTKL
ncbi:hypothetical protein BU23DRAFT_589347 [Bimuria novae-zelandiae CBS 107.79]|uniref:Uncharacterized protein n=1 Tax=Bimuria novae-zelandiae CBS 107.79 TaxID=1447943 RepID=A0A6A5VFP5_9PLEO|nr:hypothetical protein BU23DRAFT_589347 [Bimuria novae-zelandiae CBS 107.79]